MGLLKKIMGYLSRKDETEPVKASIGAKAYGLTDEYFGGTPKSPKNKNAAERYVFDQLLADNGHGIYDRVHSAKEFGMIGLDGIVSDAVNTYLEGVVKTKEPAKKKEVPKERVMDAKDRKAWSSADAEPYKGLIAYFDRKAGKIPNNQANAPQKDLALTIWAKNAGVPVIGDERLVFVDQALQSMRTNQKSN